MTRSIAWTTKDLEKLSLFHKTRMPIKEMAKNLGRTPSAVNKILERHQIRSKRPKEKVRDHFATKEMWVQLPTVIEFLKYHGHRIESCVHPSDPSLTFMVDKRPRSALFLLFIANRIRSFNHQPTFMVENVTEA